MDEVDLFHSCSVNNELTAPSLGGGTTVHASSGGLYVCTFLLISVVFCYLIQFKLKQDRGPTKRDICFRKTLALIWCFCYFTTKK